MNKFYRFINQVHSLGFQFEIKNINNTRGLELYARIYETEPSRFGEGKREINKFSLDKIIEDESNLYPFMEEFYKKWEGFKLMNNYDNLIDKLI